MLFAVVVDDEEAMWFLLNRAWAAGAEDGWVAGPGREGVAKGVEQAL